MSQKKQKKKDRGNKLNVFYEDILVGELLRDSELIYSFSYSNEWMNNPKKFQLSIAMPFQKEPFGNKITLSFFENLLPEGEARDALAKSHNLESTFEFLKEFGKDCAGAVIVTSDSASPLKKSNGKAVKIELNQIYKAIDQKRSVAEVIASMDPGYLSIAGAQDKFSAIFKEDQFYLPSGGRPTTHIVKVPIYRSEVKESVYNEYYCMKLARRVGLNVPECFIIDNINHPLYVISRYDRFTDNNGSVHRIHQQDFCQAQGIVSEQKYEDKGGPNIKDNYHLIKTNVTIKKRSSALLNYLDWICFNFLIGNNDGHSKNLSFLLNNNKIELAPFYDLMCTAIYPKLKRNFSFKIGDRDNASRIGKNQLEILDCELGLKKGTSGKKMLLMIEKLFEHKDALASEIRSEYPHAKIVKRIAELIRDRSTSLSKQGLTSGSY
ncbi:MAG: type II toxin-antitoxin system HipA family toxin [Oligoflexia bacterium]|nr:type II toxin-antitoxin system HipA family toxin [Oligoflexia bacterium]